jgi:hypothetical protein
VDEQYRNTPFPFTRIHAPVFFIEYEWTTDQLEGYFNTWSALQKFIATNQYNPVDELMTPIKSFWEKRKNEHQVPYLLPYLS